MWRALLRSWGGQLWQWIVNPETTGRRSWLLAVGNTFTVVRAHIGIQSIHGHEALGAERTFTKASWGNQWISCWKCFHVATWGLGVSQSVRNENTGHPDIIWICACDWKSPTCLCKWPGRRQSPMAWGQSWRDGKEHKHVWMILFRTKIYMKLLNIHSMVWQGRRGITRIVCMAIFAARPGPGFRAHILFMWWGCKSFPLMCFIILSRLPLLRCDP